MFKEKLKNFFYVVVVVFSAWSITFNIFWLAMNECPRIPVKNSRSTFFYFFLNNASFVFFSSSARVCDRKHTHDTQQLMTGTRVISQSVSAVNLRIYSKRMRVVKFRVLKRRLGFVLLLRDQKKHDMPTIIFMRKTFW